MPRRRDFYEPIIESPTRRVVPEGWPFHSAVDQASEAAAPEESATTEALPPAVDEQPLVGFQVNRPGVYLRVEDLVAVLRSHAAEWDRAGNPSAALALRDFADSLEGGQ